MKFPELTLNQPTMLITYFTKFYLFIYFILFLNFPGPSGEGIQASIYACMYIYIYTYKYVYTYVYTYIFIHTYIHMYIYIHIGGHLLRTSFGKKISWHREDVLSRNLEHLENHILRTLNKTYTNLEHPRGNKWESYILRYIDHIYNRCSKYLSSYECMETP